MADESEVIAPPAISAVTLVQKSSIAELPLHRRYSLYERITYEDRSLYFSISCRPITKRAEDDMELISDIITWGEEYLHNFNKGVYRCARCALPLYSSSDKWKGPCLWPSFRSQLCHDATSATVVYPYNNYVVTVKEVYCSGCDLFIGHQFEDGKAKGDVHPEAHWRH